MNCKHVKICSNARCKNEEVACSALHREGCKAGRFVPGCKGKCITFSRDCYQMTNSTNVPDNVPIRLNKLFLYQNKDRKEFNILLKKQEFKFFKEHICSYRVNYERVIPTARYHRTKLPKPSFCILRRFFRKYMQSRLIKFVKRQINDRNKEENKRTVDIRGYSWLP